jgi:hypothetical protein
VRGQNCAPATLPCSTQDLPRSSTRATPYYLMIPGGQVSTIAPDEPAGRVRGG